MKKHILLFVFIFFFHSSYSTEDWGPTGHRAVGKIAEKYLTPEVAYLIDEILDGQSLALVSTFADEIRSDSRYREFAPWHYVNFPFDSTYEDTPKSEKGDIVVAIKECISILKNKETSKEDKAFYLKLLVHFMGDLHQPLHIGLSDDKGGNTFQVQWFDEGANLHWVWDEKIIEQFGMSYTELTENTQKLSKEELENIKKGTIEDWMYEGRTLCIDVYNQTKVGEKLGYEYMYRYAHKVRSQLQKGGIRLAQVLNSIFS
ncbi:MAG: S1/P1 nuclease [Flavobacteriaceae bacterium]